MKVWLETFVYVRNCLKTNVIEGQIPLLHPHRSPLLLYLSGIRQGMDGGLRSPAAHVEVFFGINGVMRMDENNRLLE